MPDFRHLIVASVLVVTATSIQAEVIDIDNDTLARLIDEGVPVIDIRRDDEWTATGVIDDSHLMTFFDAKGDYDASAWRSALDAIVSSDEPVVLICRTGRRTGLVSRWLSEEEGFVTVYNVAEGIVSWKRDAGETVTADGCGDGVSEPRSLEC